MSAFKLLLLPFALLYDMITRIRNRMYDTNWKPSVEFDLPVLCVGNLAVGGTGKTPMIEYLIRLASPSLNVATLSRGYGRKTRGFRITGENDTALTVGDEPYQLFTKYKDHVTVIVGEERALAIPLLLDEHPDVKVVLLDDAFQHRKVKAGFSVLLTEFENPFFSDYVMPYGRLREHARGAVRADVIVVTKCPRHMDDDTTQKFERAIATFSDKPVFFSTLRYGKPSPIKGIAELQSRVVLVSGIANPASLESHIQENYQLVKHFAFRDHHFYTRNDLQKIEQFVNTQYEPVSIITTEKDRVKLEHPDLNEYVAKLPFFSLPIEMEFIRNGKDFDALVLEFVNRGH